MTIKQAKEIVQALPSLYPLKDFEEEAISLLLKETNSGEFKTDYVVRKKEYRWW